MGVAFPMLGSLGASLIAGGIGLQASQGKQIDRTIRDSQQAAADQAAADAAHQASSGEKRRQFTAIPDIASASQAPHVFAEFRRQMTRNSRAGSFLTGHGGTLANKSLLTAGM